jgi:predicted DCC family thiol-disulfide oxidoreductase YuxK
MTCYSHTPYSYRGDCAVPSFDDGRPLFVFDGHCGLCSGGVRWLMHVDRERRIAFTSAQGNLGSALYRHYGTKIDTTYLLIDRGEAFGMSGGYFRLLPYLSRPWQIFRIFAVVPEPLRDALYGLIARNRYRWFGRYDHCALLTPDQRSRLD